MNQEFEDAVTAAIQSVVDEFQTSVSGVTISYVPAATTPPVETFKVTPTPATVSSDSSETATV